MLSFKTVELEDLVKFNDFFKYRSSRSCDDSIGGLFIFRRYFDTKYLIEDEILYFQITFNSKLYHYIPIAKEESKIALGISRLNTEFKTLSFAFLTKDDIPYFSDFNISPEIILNWSDYLYLASDLAELSGSKYQKIRNRVNSFYRNYRHVRFEELNANNVLSVKEFYLRTFEESLKQNEMLEIEKESLLIYFDNFNKFQAETVVLFIDNLVVGFALAEIINDTIFVHTEKADKRFTGAYQVLMNYFARFARDLGIKYVNREDDASEVGLKISKESYHPIMMIDKYSFDLKKQ